MAEWTVRPRGWGLCGGVTAMILAALIANADRLSAGDVPVMMQTQEAELGGASLWMVDGKGGGNGEGPRQSRKRLQAGQDRRTPGHNGMATSVLGECSGCHANRPVLAENHVSTVGMPYAHCLTCHGQALPAGPLSGAFPLDHVHAAVGLGCLDCHEDADLPEDPGMEFCLTCHEPLDALFTATRNVPPTNPHDSPHGEIYLECSLCHLQHSLSENFCATCHDFEFRVP